MFSREPDGLKLSVPSDITPIPIDESVASLSAILLDDNYYQLLMKGKTIDSKDIKKHKNDILRLMMYVMPDKRIEIPKEVYSDIEDFLVKMSEESVNLKNLGIRSISLKELLIRIEKLFIRV